MGGNAGPSTDGGPQTATLGGGCFWCLEPIFDDLRGVMSVESGYAGGHVQNPTYRQVCNGNTVHAEVGHGFGPAEVLQKVNTAILRHHGGARTRFATMVHASLTVGATDVVVAATHGVLSGRATERLSSCGARGIILTNTLPIADEKRFPGMTVLSIAPLLARAIQEVFEDGSVTSLFDGNA